MFIITNLSYMQEYFFIDRNISAGSIVVVASYDGAGDLNEQTRELLRRVSEARENEEVFSGIYRLESILQDGEWFKTEEVLIRKYDGIIVFEDISAEILERGYSEYGKEVSLKELFDRLKDREELYIGVDDVLLAEFGFLSGRRFKKVLTNIAYGFGAFLILLVLFYTAAGVREKAVNDEIETVRAQIEEKKAEFRKNKKKFYSFLKGVKVEDIKSLEKVSFLPFIPKTIYAEVGSGKQTAKGDIYIQDLVYTQTLCRELKLNCNIKFKGISKGVEIYEVAASPK